MHEASLPGIPLRKQGEPYGFEKHLEEYGNGDNNLRTERLAQPRALKIGDILATGNIVLSAPRDAGKGGVWIHLTGGRGGDWVEVSARIPIALLAKEDNAPQAIWDLEKKALEDFKHLDNNIEL